MSGARFAGNAGRGGDENGQGERGDVSAVTGGAWSKSVV